ncbi:hypothetical protein MES5069_160019 [Mesorhizobium escarrei]|uniref:Uncharacterized protein n=1 Tax=Mesorhizobium escarrei TaxID=666018 RepID=A0ABM9DLM0_9HYPH|nr:hypothetical protein MES5069_160019 [Mesorhizobium escarrei]
MRYKSPWCWLGSTKGRAQGRMKYTKKDAKNHSRRTMRGIWAAALTPFKPDSSIDEDGMRRNFEHWISDLQIDGFFIAASKASSSPCPSRRENAVWKSPSMRPRDALKPSCPVQTRISMW